MLRYYNPIREIDVLRREVERIFNGYPSSGLNHAFRSTVEVNVYDDADDVTVEAVLPGVDPKALDLTVLRSELTISGERKAEEGVKAEAWHRQERPAGKFVRKVALPAEVDAANVKADYKDGILTVRMAKSEAARPRRIEVAVG